MEQVTSRDGTAIAYTRTGTGAPLVLVHGATATAARWAGSVAVLAEHFTVYAVDRRGRGASGDGPVYGLQREAEDIAAVVEAIGEPATLLGHSFGALCALEAALLTPNLHRLILYEGVPLHGADAYQPGAIDKLDALLRRGDADGMLETMFREVVGMPEEELALLRSKREVWAQRLTAAPTVPRELRADAGYVFQPERFRDMHTPTLLLLGGESAPIDRANAEGVAAALPDARVAILPGQRHIAMDTAPELFVREVRNFIEPRRGQI